MDKSYCHLVLTVILLSFNVISQHIFCDPRSTRHSDGAGAPEESASPMDPFGVAWEIGHAQTRFYAIFFNAE